MPTSEYYSAELRIAQDSSHPAHRLPQLPATYSRILDVGCGDGHSLRALGVPPQKGFGVDVAATQNPFGYSLHACRAERMPFPDEYFDFVMCRVTLPYLNIPVALKEIHRVMARGGKAWFLLHGWRRTRRRWLESIRKTDFKDFAFCNYVCLNSVLLLRNLQLPFMGRYESFQTNANVKVVFTRARLRIVSIQRGEFFEVTVERD